MLLSIAVSRRFKIVSALSMIGILFIHSKFINSRWGEDFGTSFYSYVSVSLQYLISEQITRICVPLFFIISGYFFYHKYEGGRKSYYLQLQKRFRSTLIPYFLWSLSWFILYNITSLTLLDFSDLFNRLINPIPYQFWFLQILLFCFIVSPAFYFLIKKLPKITILILLIFYFMNVNSFKSEIYGFGFFYLGGYLRYFEIKLSKKLITFLISMYLLTIIMGLILFILQDNEYFYYRVLLHKISILSGILLVIRYISHGVNNEKFFENYILSMDGGFFFFVFAAHEPLLSFLKKIWIQLFSDSYNILAYFVLPLIILFGLYACFKLLKKKIPFFLTFYTGNR